MQPSKVILSLVLAALTLAVALLLPGARALALFALLLALIAGIYIGFALLDGRRAALAIEIPVAFIFFAMAYFGLWNSPYILAAGYIGHGIWDAMHHPHGLQTRVVSWYPSACLIYDVVVGTFIVIRWWR